MRSELEVGLFQSGLHRSFQSALRLHLTGSRLRIRGAELTYDGQEAQTRRIELEEEDWVIQALLRYLYEQPYAPTMATEGCKDANIAAEIKRQIKIHKAADKVRSVT